MVKHESRVRYISIFCANEFNIERTCQVAGIRIPPSPMRRGSRKLFVVDFINFLGFLVSALASRRVIRLQIFDLILA